ncbi:MAG: hypothetical protein EBZ69_03365 [Alphaproteobacteria bacterium]|nr:hypothetical protein [Alphaproteobacteria bacterium]NDC55840.1 hypothetical protein [Alphaproteobacteria bacterium]
MVTTSRTSKNNGFLAKHGRAIIMFILLLAGISLLVYISSIAKPMKELNCSGASAGINAFGSCK